MSDIARDYRAALALLRSNPTAHFVAVAGNGIRTEAAVTRTFAARGLKQVQIDAEVGRVLVALYNEAVEIGHEAVDPRDIDVAARFVQAYEAQRLAAGGPSVGPPLRARSASRSASDAVTGPVEAGRSARPPTRHPAQVRATDMRMALERFGFDHFGRYVRALTSLAQTRSSRDLQTINAAALGAGNIMLKTLFDRPECTDPQLPRELRREAYARYAPRFVQAAKAQYEASLPALLEQKVAQTGEDERDDLWQTIQANVPLQHRLFELASDTRNVDDADFDAIVDYVRDAQNLGLSVDGAMIPIRMWMGDADTPLGETWKAEPSKAPDLALADMLGDLMDKTGHLTEEQFRDMKPYLPPTST